MEVCNECCSEEHDEPMPQAIEHDPNDPVTQDAILIASLVRGRADNACMPIVMQPTVQVLNHCRAPFDALRPSVRP